MRKEIVKDITNNNPYWFWLETNYFIYIWWINIWYLSIIEISDIDSYYDYLWIHNIHKQNFIKKGSYYISYIHIEKEYRWLWYWKYLLNYVLNETNSNYYSLIIRDKRYWLNPEYTYNLIDLYSKLWFIINNNIIINEHLYMEKNK